jgi:hypothetical protein
MDVVFASIFLRWEVFNLGCFLAATKAWLSKKTSTLAWRHLPSAENAAINDSVNANFSGYSFLSGKPANMGAKKRFKIRVPVLVSLIRTSLLDYYLTFNKLSKGRVN